MEKNLSCKWTCIILIFINIIINKFILRDTIASIIISIDIIAIVYLNGRFKYASYKRIENIELEEKKVAMFFSIKDIKYKKNKFLKDDYLFSIVLIPMVTVTYNFFAAVFFSDINKIGKDGIKSIAVWLLVIVVFAEYDRIFKIFERYRKSNNPLIIVNDFGNIEWQENLKCAKHHLKFEAIKIQYKIRDHSKDFLKNELAYIKGRSAKFSKPGVYITIIFPILIVIVTSIINSITIYLDRYLLVESSTPEILNEFLAYSIGFPMLFILIIVVLSICYEGPSYTNLEDLKLRECVLEELIEMSEKKNNLRNLILNIYDSNIFNNRLN